MGVEALLEENQLLQDIINDLYMEYVTGCKDPCEYEADCDVCFERWLEDELRKKS